MAEAEWYYSQNGQQQGPVTLQALQDMLRAGQVKSTDMAWKPGLANWMPSGQIPELAPPPVGYPAPAPAPHYPQQPQQPYAASPQQPQAGYGQPLGYQPPVQYAQPSTYGSAPSPFDSKATTALTLSIVGIFCFGPILGIIAIVLASQASSGMKSSGNRLGQGKATAAMVIGIIDVVLGLLGLFAILARH